MLLLFRTLFFSPKILSTFDCVPGDRLCTHPYPVRFKHHLNILRKKVRKSAVHCLQRENVKKTFFMSQLIKCYSPSSQQIFLELLHFPLKHESKVVETHLHFNVFILIRYYVAVSSSTFSPLSPVSPLLPCKGKKNNKLRCFCYIYCVFSFKPINILPLFPVNPKHTETEQLDVATCVYTDNVWL